MKKRYLLPLAAFLCITAVFALSAINLSHTARLVPIFVLFVTGCLLAAAVVQVSLAWPKQAAANLLEEDESLNESPSGINDEGYSLLNDLSWFLGAPSLIVLFGLVGGSTFYVTLFVRLRANLSMGRSAIYGIGAGALLFAVTQILPQSQIYQGLLLFWL